ncbi:patatin-like phospholipase domain containing 3 isoform X1 [Archocentrus centrarchus]|uniref:patatin-like phospholipase domain containing 3 isoform X1 n=1 Tax=Archocentrus centrarchus TaxID=63155 RepID=UPI0011EA4374|nr:patatin-like phospholipase domain-containing protein 2 isoform X1 [Archocentrus centrarchus]
MFDLSGGWNLSFAGCGFLGIYHVGVASCLLEKAPYIIKGATKLYGASAGALTASMLASQAPIAKCCQDVIEVAKEARKRNLGPLHPTFNLVKVLRSGLNRDLPSDAHILASGRLCVSLTRVTDGENVLVSEFSSKEELIQALICSCFIPIYCGLIPPSFRGVRYVDGGISDNLPQSELKNTITVSPFSGESDICPRDKSTSFHELRFTNTSIQMNMGNMYRLSRALFPPEPKVLAEMCQSGYKDALHFLEENNLLVLGCPTAGPSLPESSISCCKNTETNKEWVLRRLRLLRKQHWWLDEHISLPTSIKKVFCEACQERSGLYAKVSGTLPMRVASYMLMPYTLPVQSAYSVAQRFVEWIPEVPADVRWLFGVAGDVYRQAWKGERASSFSEPCLRKCLSVPPLPSEYEPTQKDIPPALSSLNLHNTYWEIPKSTNSSSHQSQPAIVPSSPQQVCFFVGMQDEP